MTLRPSWSPSTLVALGLLASCAPAAPAHHETALEPQSKSVPAPPAVHSVSPIPPAAPGEPPGPSSPFFMVKEGNSLLSFSVMLDGGVLLHDGDTVWRARPRDVEKVADVRAALPPPEDRGTSPALVSLAGRWPDAAWLSLGDVGGGAALYRWSGSAWRKEQSGARFLAASRWTEGRSLALARHALAGERSVVEARFRLLEGASATLPEIPPPSGRARCFGHAAPFAFTALSSGDAFLLGQDCDGPDPPYKVLATRWGPGQTKGITDALPGGESLVPEGEQDGRIGDVYARSATEVFAVVNATSRADRKRAVPYLARFDGRAWTRVDIPATDPLVSVSGSDDGVLWVASFRDLDGTGTLWRRAPAGTWHAVRLPALAGSEGKHEQLVPLHVRATTPNDVWVLTQTTRWAGRKVVLRIRRDANLAL